MGDAAPIAACGRRRWFCGRHGARASGLQSNPTAVVEGGVSYGHQRGELEYGLCEVSIPKVHQVGELEAPSILRLEVHQDVSKHVVLHSTVVRDADQFFRGVAEVVAGSPQRDVFVFVHGYNVTFENAARRTAQMAYDLKFQGAPIFYSWPSQGGLLTYTVDENNVAWSTPHLKQFLLDIAHKSNANSVNLIAQRHGEPGADHGATNWPSSFARMRPCSIRSCWRPRTWTPKCSAATSRPPS